MICGWVVLGGEGRYFTLLAVHGVGMGSYCMTFNDNKYGYLQIYGESPTACAPPTLPSSAKHAR